jgi:hypothetical protein
VFPGVNASVASVVCTILSERGGCRLVVDYLTAIRSIGTIGMSIFAVGLAVAIFDGGAHVQRLCLC